MKQFIVKCHESLSSSDIFENLKQCYPQMIFDVTEQVRPTLAAPDEEDSPDADDDTNPYLLSAQEIERTLALRR